MTHKIVDVIGSARIVGGEIGRFDKGVIWVFGRPDHTLSLVDVIPPHTLRP